ncbi:MAG: prolyl oligopeptidase family serine peptidase [Lentisphaeria bacterium]|nr:prolyl oligopeptidase family serine peptidase [Lentisphaeria bacterium]
MKTEDLRLPEEHTTDTWQGGTRHRFTLFGCETWVVEPVEPAQGNRWFAVPEWPTAYPTRNGAAELLRLGFYMVHIRLFGQYACPEAVEVMYSFYEWMRERGFAEKGAMIGMSLGGLYSFRFAETHPECVACIYADAPVCDLGFGLERDYRVDGIMKSYHLTDRQQMADHPLSPVNNYSAMVKAGIPVLMILGLDDNVVNHKTNGSLLAERYQAAGGTVRVVGRESWGHHPHGLDDPAQIVRFILSNTIW